MPASLHAAERRGPSPCARRLLRHVHLLLGLPRALSTVHLGCSAPAPAPHGRTVHGYPGVCRGRYEGTEMLLGRSARTSSSLPSSCTRQENLKTCVGQPGCRGTSRRKSRQHMGPGDHGSAEKSGKKGNNPLLGVVCLLTTGDLIRVRRVATPVYASYANGMYRLTSASGLACPTRTSSTFRRIGLKKYDKWTKIPKTSESSSPVIMNPAFSFGIRT